MRGVDSLSDFVKDFSLRVPSSLHRVDVQNRTSGRVLHVFVSDVWVPFYAHKIFM